MESSLLPIPDPLVVPLSETKTASKFIISLQTFTLAEQELQLIVITSLRELKESLKCTDLTLTLKIEFKWLQEGFLQRLLSTEDI